MGCEQYERVEFVIEICGQSKVLAFVECTTSAGISFGQPKRLVFKDYKITGRDNYERTTIHKDGRLEAHFNLMENWNCQTTPLEQWNRTMSFSREFYDVGGLSLSYLEDLKPKPKRKVVQVQLNSLECRIWFAVAPSAEQDDVSCLEWLNVPQVQCWMLSDNWPAVIVGISNLVEPVNELIEIESVGWDYREKLS